MSLTAVTGLVGDKLGVNRKTFLCDIHHVRLTNLGRYTRTLALRRSLAPLRLVGSYLRRLLALAVTHRSRHVCRVPTVAAAMCSSSSPWERCQEVPTEGAPKQAAPPTPRRLSLVPPFRV